MGVFHLSEQQQSSLLLMHGVLFLWSVPLSTCCTENATCITMRVCVFSLLTRLLSSCIVHMSVL